MTNRVLITVAVVLLAALTKWVLPNGLRSTSPSSMAATEIAPSAPLR